MAADMNALSDCYNSTAYRDISCACVRPLLATRNVDFFPPPRHLLAAINEPSIVCLSIAVRRCTALSSSTSWKCHTLENTYLMWDSPEMPCISLQDNHVCGEGNIWLEMEKTGWKVPPPRASHAVLVSYNLWWTCTVWSPGKQSAISDVM